MHSSRYLALLALLTLAVLSAASSYSEDDDASDDSATTPEEAPSTTPEIQGQARNALDDALLAGILKGLAGNPAIAHAATPMPCTQVEGVDRKHGHKKHCKGGHADECEDQDKEKAKCKGDKNKDKCNGCCGHQPTPTYHISLHGQEDRYKTISLPAQGQPYFYGDDERFPRPPIVHPDCCQGYCYKPCCQPTCGICDKHGGKMKKNKGGKGY